ncbi:MAG: response regulator [Gaiellales bacterium]
MSIRVVIADDQELIRTGFRMILETEDDIEVVGEAATGREAVTLARRLHPDVVLMDIRMPELDGIEATRQVTALGSDPPTRILILTTFDLDEYVFDALRAGASGFLLKDVRADQLASGVRMITAGDSLLAPSITRRLIDEFAGRPSSDHYPGLSELTPRELEVLQLMAAGNSNAEIASHLFIGESTVKTHVARVLTKLGVRDRVQAVVAAYEAGVVTPGQRKAGTDH